MLIKGGNQLRGQGYFRNQGKGMASGINYVPYKLYINRCLAAACNSVQQGG
jgi:hypothetical protein